MVPQKDFILNKEATEIKKTFWIEGIGSWLKYQGLNLCWYKETLFLYQDHWITAHISLICIHTALDYFRIQIVCIL